MVGIAPSMEENICTVRNILEKVLSTVTGLQCKIRKELKKKRLKISKKEK